ncbi:ComEC/Rec2 family competence protein [Deinococcus malanensis]|uniref:ComEC/Rec2 family competence protein n=1 Tax=Deinococcus malanensis TaxID=1706855 RepID=UPI003637D69F
MSGKKEPKSPRRAASAGRKSPSRKTTPKSRRKAATRSGPSSSDVTGLVVLLLTASLAACAGSKVFGDKEPAGEAKATVPAGEMTIRFLDIGQGDAVLVRSPEGKTLLLDGGRSAERMRDHMKTYGVDKIDLMIASHADADHIAGLVAAAEARPMLFINNGLGGTTRTWERLVDALREQGTTFQKANRQVVNLGSVKVRVIAPPLAWAATRTRTVWACAWSSATSRP